MEPTSGADMQARKKTEVQSPAEQTRPGLLFTPAVDIFESDQEITLLADMPGVKADELSIDLKDNTLTILGNVESPKKKDEVDIFMEYRTGNYFRQFTLSELIDQGGIEAGMKDGVLKLVLPKIKKAAPRKITVTAA